MTKTKTRSKDASRLMVEFPPSAYCDLKHNFPLIAYDIDMLCEGTKKLATFMRRLREQSRENPDHFDPDTYMGWGFECFVESLIHQFESDSRVYIQDYTPVQHDDYGVDGVGYGIGGDVHTVQCKARTDNTRMLNDLDDHLSNFVAHSACRYKVDCCKDGLQPMTVFTTAAGIRRETATKTYDNKVRCINYKQLRLLVDKNEMFWKKFRDQMKLRKAQ